MGEFVALLKEKFKNEWKDAKVDIDFSKFNSFEEAYKLLNRSKAKFNEFLESNEVKEISKESTGRLGAELCETDFTGNSPNYESTGIFSSCLNIGELAFKIDGKYLKDIKNKKLFKISNNGELIIYRLQQKCIKMGCILVVSLLHLVQITHLLMN